MLGSMNYKLCLGESFLVLVLLLSQIGIEKFFTLFLSQLKVLGLMTAYLHRARQDLREMTGIWENSSFLIVPHLALVLVFARMLHSSHEPVIVTFTVPRNKPFSEALPLAQM